MFSISNMFVHAKRHKLTHLSASACISVAPPLCHRRRRHYTPAASLLSKQWTFPRGCKKSYPVLYENEKTAEEHRRGDKSPPFPPTHQWGCTGKSSSDVSIHLWPKNHQKCKKNNNNNKKSQWLVISPASVLMDGFRRKAPNVLKDKGEP